MPRLVLSPSAPARLAAEANRWLTIADAPIRLTDIEVTSTTLAPVKDPDAVLCRTNVRALVVSPPAGPGQRRADSLRPRRRRRPHRARSVAVLRRDGADCVWSWRA
ncbi:hypothetical protein ACQEVG_38165 [Streptomyces sp. CA-135486]|uniref:hypothetical protein n=1 Tax=Streptomyces sp. CA-135486 TaxID=3240049 RepID=UPI003D8BCAB2